MQQCQRIFRESTVTVFSIDYLFSQDLTAHNCTRARMFCLGPGVQNRRLLRKYHLHQSRRRSSKRERWQTATDRATREAVSYSEMTEHTCHWTFWYEKVGLNSFLAKRVVAAMHPQDSFAPFSRPLIDLSRNCQMVGKVWGRTPTMAQVRVSSASKIEPW